MQGKGSTVSCVLSLSVVTVSFCVSFCVPDRRQIIPYIGVYFKKDKIYVYLCVCACRQVGTQPAWMCGDESTACSVALSIFWGPGRELRSTDLAASAFTLDVTSVVL